MSIVSAPASLWQLYVEHLWNYTPGSWVDSAAWTFRMLAFLSILPFAILTLLDVTSYVIARTLGVIDDTKASTSETGSVPTGADTPTIVIQPESPPPTKTTMTSPPPTYFRGPLEEEGNLELSGVGMFSPVPSQPPSPTISRRELSSHMHNISEERKDEGMNAIHPDRPASRASSSGESSFAMLDQESGAEDTPVTLRRRAPTGTGPSREDS
ncbi:uncharacterized protein B0H18DRAFT_415449 [Fomitopsis serialis]|uniref:uncharacterized protein n=1 Tax=Fomitopsis serialis TaxID=139415 RepID=UPI002007B07D|nr:uncharacterized protein B0H18DRAFT_415449 [Neoantrodia serialis]KAH9935527.1 hypothetical protein B0H18DRAFT_415449 [Neoantrodia serialis]